MVTYKTKNGTIIISKIKDLSIKEINLGKEVPSWYKLRRDSYYIEVIPKKPSIKKIGGENPILSFTKRYLFLNSNATDEYNALLDVKRGVEIAVESEIYPQILLDIINEVIDSKPKK
jgi:hypothetical protein